MVIHGFTHFERRFFRNYSKVTLLLMELLKNTEVSLRAKKWPHAAKWEWTREAEMVFWNLNRTVTKALNLQHFDLTKLIIIQTDASGFTIEGILKQYEGFGVLMLVNFYFQTCSSAEENYDTYRWELLAIMHTLKQWQHYLEGANHKVFIWCDHRNLEYFQTSKVLSRRQARWLETLSAHDLVIALLECSKTLAYGPSRQPDYEIT